MSAKLKSIAGHFISNESITEVIAFGSGHINDTFKVSTSGNTFLLQRVNHQIFKDVEGLTRNLILVSDHLERKISENGEKMIALRSLPSSEDQFIFVDSEGAYWRMFDFIENSYSFDRVEDKTLALNGGEAFGWFVSMLNDFPVEQLIETIPRFHNAKFRIENFKQAVEKDVAGRLLEIKDLVDSLLSRSASMMKIYDLAEGGQIPVRVTHNDTKINNVLFNSEREGLCIIDLDTVMPGLVHFDFGDSIRTFTNTGDEDSRNTDEVSMSLEYFEAYAKGFLKKTKDILNPVEKEHLAFAPLYITYEQTIRFLTDYLEGDVYYKIHDDTHNLVRARAQFKLLMSMEESYGQMQAIIQRICSD